MRPSPVAIVAFIMFVAAWFFPVHKEGITLADGLLPGWQAFMLAFMYGPLGIPSALSNGLFFVLLYMMTKSPGAKLEPWLKPAFVIAAGWNAWPVVMIGPFEDFLIGYWLWLSSFVVMAISLVLTAAKESTSTETRRPAARVRKNVR